ncbi:MAG: hypothetical protein AAAB20_16965 [Rhizobium sp.]|uniref:hypothetical protein n=1 Tax=Rhizobium sp. TaxID=391 RepID=UPI0005632E02
MISSITPHDESGKLNFKTERIEPMAKGQMRSNRETRKPKQEKSPVKVEATFANQVKDATKSSPQGGKHKR